MDKVASSPGRSPPPPISTKPLPFLPPDTLAIILNFLSISKSTSTLHSCALVNRMWCRLSIPLLWSNPLSLILQSSPSDWCMVERNSALIIETYVACLSNEERLQFIGSTETIDHGEPEKISEMVAMTRFRMNNPLFDYTAYLKNVDCEQLRGAVDCWVNLMYDTLNLPSTFNPTAYLANVLFKRSKGIKSLSFRYLKETTLHSMDISRFTGAQDALRKLENFDVVYYPSNKYLTSYSAGAQSSSFMDGSRSVFALIKSQRHLRCLKLNEFFLANQYEDLCSALSTQEPFNGISIRELHISRCPSQNSILHLLNLVSPFHLQRLAIDNCTTEIIDTIIERAPNLTHLDMRVAPDVELQRSGDIRTHSTNIRMYSNSNYSTVNVCECDAVENESFPLHYESDLDTFEEFIISTKNCLHHLRCLEHFVLRLNTNTTDSDFEIIDSVREILDSLPRSTSRVGLEMNFGSIQELCIVLSGRRGDDLGKLDLCWQGKSNFEEVVEVLNRFWEDEGWESEEVKKVRLFCGYGDGLANNGKRFLNDASTRAINVKQLGEMLNENIVMDVIESPFIPLHFA
ncbi:1207_t:CDS:2 [Acaulospora morrowiae]|uniref:1207_t:CDS:1 n=1 Tax=Acaulospora morrowiae TaxID=94023 RepID=A0A9N8W6Z2_9GLOM|nr:1207_t:CDS:2 [Acaulospora morrowiae]